MSNIETGEDRRRMSPAERRFFRAPNANVVMVTRIKGEIAIEDIRSAFSKLQQRHRFLQVRIELEKNGDTFFTNVKTGPVLIKSFPLLSSSQWMELSLKEHAIPFDLENSPPIRLLLLQGDHRSELIILCHHIICDGSSLAYLTRDLLTCLGDPSHQLEILPEPPVVSRTLPNLTDTSRDQQNPVNTLNSHWRKEEVRFDTDDYISLFKSYWENNTFHVISLEFTKDQTDKILTRCRENKAKMNSALLTCLLAAQYQVQGDTEEYLGKTGTAVSLRRYLVPPPDEVMGFYAAGALVDFRLNPDTSFWQNVRRLHECLQKQITKEALVEKYLATEHVAPTILDAIQFKRFGRMVKPADRKHLKLTRFAERDDTILDLQKRRARKNKRGVILTNLSNITLPERFGKLEIERMLFYPGTTEVFEKAVGAVTTNGRLTIIISYIEEVIQPSVMRDYTNVLLKIMSREYGMDMENGKCVITFS